MLRTDLWVICVLLALALAPAHAVDLAISADSYATGGLFTNPLIPAEGDTVTITVRATVQGEVPTGISADVAVTAPDRASRHFPIELTPEEGQATGTLQWKAWQNGLYRVTATLDPDNAIAESNEQNNSAAIDLPVVIAGRQPHFPYWHVVADLRWATIWAGGITIDKQNAARWQERGVLPLEWKWGTNLPGEWGEDEIYEMMLDFGEAPGGAVDECGYYPTPESIDQFQTYVRGMARAKKELPDKFFMMWHCGSLYPEQAALYRGACDLVALESYVFNWSPGGLENWRQFLDMKMLPARQCDLLGPTGKGTQVITTVDLDYLTFNRGMMESIFRHLRRTWPEMRGLGFYGGLDEAPQDQQAQRRAEEQAIDRLCYEYFIAPVVTVLPGNLWVNRQDDGSYLVTAAVSNIGGMDSGPVAVSIYADGKALKTVQLKHVPAGNNLKENQIRVEARWTPRSGAHRLRVELGPALGSTILDAEAEMGYYVP